MRRTWTGTAALMTVGAAVVAACSTDPAVRTEESNTMAAPLTTTTSTTTTSTTTTTPTTTTSTAPATEAEGLRFELSDFTVEVTLRETLADTPPGGYDGFMSALELPDGSLVASGFDARGDGFQPERSALWKSEDGIGWDRVGTSLGDTPDQQSINALYLDDDGTVHALLTHFATVLDDQGLGGLDIELAVEWTSVDGVAWGSRELIGNDYIAGAELVDGDVLAYGADLPNSIGEYTASISRQASGSAEWLEAAIVDDDGQPFAASVVVDMVAAGDLLVAVGASAHTDPLSGLAGSLLDMLLAIGPSDVAIWRSPDGGITWEFVETEAFSGASGPGVGDVIVELDGDLYLLSRTVSGYRTVVDLHRSADGGTTWERIRIERAIAGGGGTDTILSNYGLYAVDGFLVVLEERFGDEQLMTMTVLDPATDESVTHELTAELGVNQVEDIIQSGSVGLGFGRLPSGRLASDLQVVEIRRLD